MRWLFLPKYKGFYYFYIYYIVISEWSLQLGKFKHLFQEWKVFVSEQSFSKGLTWLERQVALRQARQRGFFTYGDLAAACDAAALVGAARGATAACLGVALGYVAGLLALVASALVASQTCLPTQSPALRNTTGTLEAHPTTYSPSDITPPLSNTTVDLQTYTLPEESTLTFDLRSCDEWVRYEKESIPKKTWYDGIVMYDLKSLEPWWSKTSVMNWLYQSSLINPMQRWLDKLNQYIYFFKKEMDCGKAYISSDQCNSCPEFGERRCVRQWLNLSKLSVFVASMSDR